MTNLNISSWIEAIKLIDELQHRTLYLVISSLTVIETKQQLGEL